jgi:homoserine kinase
VTGPGSPVRRPTPGALPEGTPAPGEARPRWAEAWAPASVGNLSVGFDLLGHSVGVAGDRVRVERMELGDPRGSGPPRARVVIEAIEGLDLDLPTRVEKNTSGAALLAFLPCIEPTFGFRVRIRKGIPLGSGMGGSAASAVAAVVAANALLERPLPAQELYAFALTGEAVASGSTHGDNVGPQLLGGMVLALPDRLIRLPVPWPLRCALVHPHQILETRRSREVLTEPYGLEAVVEQTANLSRVLSALFLGELDLLRGAVRDVLVEPRRTPLIPGFPEAKEAALEAGALCAGISGGGPSLFAWFEEEDAAKKGMREMVRAFGHRGVEADGWIAPVEGPAARIVACG